MVTENMLRHWIDEWTSRPLERRAREAVRIAYMSKSWIQAHPNPRFELRVPPGIAAYGMAVKTNARIRPSIIPFPNRRAKASAALWVASSRREGSRASISFLSGVPWQYAIAASRGEDALLTCSCGSHSIFVKPACSSC